MRREGTVWVCGWAIGQPQCMGAAGKAAIPHCPAGQPSGPWSWGGWLQQEGHSRATVSDCERTLPWCYALTHRLA